jgi:hypothetical protein
MSLHTEFDPETCLGINLNGHNDPLLEEMGFEQFELNLYHKNQSKEIPKQLGRKIVNSRKRLFISMPSIKSAIPYTLITAQTLTGHDPVLVQFKKDNGRYTPIFTDLYKYRQQIRRIRTQDIIDSSN